MFNQRYYKRGNDVWLIDCNLPPRAIADVISAGYNVPLETDAVVSTDELIVYLYRFERIPRPKSCFGLNRCL